MKRIAKIDSIIIDELHSGNELCMCVYDREINKMLITDLYCLWIFDDGSVKSYVDYPVLEQKNFESIKSLVHRYIDCTGIKLNDMHSQLTVPASNYFVRKPRSRKRVLVGFESNTEKYWIQKRYIDTFDGCKFFASEDKPFCPILAKRNGNLVGIVIPMHTGGTLS